MIDGTDTLAEFALWIAFVVTLHGMLSMHLVKIRSRKSCSLPLYSVLWAVEAIRSSIQETVHMGKSFDGRTFDLGKLEYVSDLDNHELAFNNIQNSYPSNFILVFQ
jgi:hypothetical protein